MSLKERAARLKTEIPAVLYALKDQRTPWYARAAAAATVCYALSPVDLIPDFIPVLGMLDDVILLPALVALTVLLLPPAVLAEARAADAPPKRWYFALPFVLIWLFLLALLLKLIFF